MQGNVLPLVAAAIIPVAGIIGGGLDLSRSYIVRARMQQACDASVLAARRAMLGTAWDSAAEQTGRQFFQANFRNGSLGTAPVSLSYQPDGDGAVTARASTVLPMTLMRIFNTPDMAVQVSCTAELQLSNTDVMFVLDTTGSMSETNPGDSITRIAALRQAVIAFHQTLENARGSSTSRVRYGFVPYSANVNVGFLLKRDWMVNSWTYQSRRPNGPPDVKTDSKTVKTNSVHISGTKKTIYSEYYAESCTVPKSSLIKNTENLRTRRTPLPGGGERVEVDKRQTINGTQYQVTVSPGKCQVWENIYDDYVHEWTETTEPATTTTYWWDYLPITYDVTPLKGNLSSGFMQGGQITVPVGKDAVHGNRTITWNGCIEERESVKNDDYAHSLDMDIDLVPTTDDRTRWRPALPELVFARNSMTNYVDAPVIRTNGNYPNVSEYASGAYAACPSRAARLEAKNASQITTYVNSLVPSGGTYHDIGLIWGARLLSPTGLFAADNSNAPNGGRMERHMIFMTDGVAQTVVNAYDAYGWPALDKRRSTARQTNDEQTLMVQDRTAYLCEAIKAKNITLWVVAFGVKSTSLLDKCASSGKAYEAGNAAALNAAFGEIASKISQLRISD